MVGVVPAQLLRLARLLVEDLHVPAGDGRVELGPLEEDVRGITRRWVEHIEDRSRPGAVRDRLVWVVEFGGDSGATFDVYVDDLTGEVIRKEGYS